MDEKNDMARIQLEGAERETEREEAVGGLFFAFQRADTKRRSYRGEDISGR